MDVEYINYTIEDTDYFNVTALKRLTEDREAWRAAADRPSIDYEIENLQTRTKNIHLGNIYIHLANKYNKMELLLVSKCCYM